MATKQLNQLSSLQIINSKRGAAIQIWKCRVFAIVLVNMAHQLCCVVLCCFRHRFTSINRNISIQRNKRKNHTRKSVAIQQQQN